MLRNRETFGADTYNLLSYLQHFKAFASDEHTVECHENPESTIPPLVSCFSKVDHNILSLADEEGGVIICDISKTGVSALKQEWMAHTNAIFDIDWVYGENKLLTASGDKSVVLWDVEREEKITVFTSHTSSVKRAQFRPQCKWVFASGGRDGHIHIWDTRVKQKAGGHHPVNSLKNPHCTQPPTQAGKKRKTAQTLSSQQSVTSVVFQDEHTLLSAGNVDGTVKVWDTRKIYSNIKNLPVPKYTFPYAGNSGRSHGFSDLVFDSSRSRLFCSCMDHIIYQYDCAAFTESPVASYQGHKIDTFYIKLALSPCDRFLLSGSSDANAYIWSVDNPMQDPVTLKGHCGEVSSVAWSPKYMTDLVTTSDDGTMRVWRLHVGDDKQEKLGMFVGKAESSHKTLDLSTCEWRTRLFPRPTKKKPFVMSPKKSCTQIIPQSPAKAALYLLSPTHGTTLPRSPAKISSTVKRAISELNTRPTTTAIRGKYQMKQLVNSSITSWLSKPLSLTTKSPRKLIITPKKQQSKHDEQQSSSPACMPCSRNSEKPEKPEKRTFKRKLTDVFGGDTVGPSTDSDSENVKSPFKKRLCTNPESLAHKERVHNTVLVSKTENSLGSGIKLTDSDFKTPVKHLTTTVINSMSVGSPQYRSPTVDLPNYVFNPEPRTPVGRVLNTTPKRTPDWLTKMRDQRDSTKKEGEQESLLRRSKSTPKSSKKAMRCSTSIEKFFSPKDTKK